MEFSVAIDMLINTPSDSLSTVFDYWQIRTGSATVEPDRVSLRDGAIAFSWPEAIAHWGGKSTTGGMFDRRRGEAFAPRS